MLDDMEAQPQPSRSLVPFIAAVVSTVALLFFYLAVSRGFHLAWTATTDWVALVAASLIAIYGAWRWLPVRSSRRTIVALVAIPVALSGMMLAALSFVCTIFGDCL